MKYQMKGIGEVELGGDRFLLSIPSVSDFHEFMGEITDRDIKMKHWEYVDPCFLYDDSGESTFIINSLFYDADEVVSFGRIDETGKVTVDDSDLAGIRPYLTPLTRDGLPDEVFNKRSGEVIRGGYFHIERGTNRNLSEIAMQPESFYVGESHAQTDIVTVDGKDKITIVDAAPADMPKKDPLRWIVVNGGLICSQAIIKCPVSDLPDLHLLPY